MSNTQYINKQEKFRLAEKIGRQLFVDYLKEKGINDVEQQHQFDAFDLSVKLNDNTIKGVEIKYRWEYASTTPFIQSDGILFEEKKFNEIFKFETTTTHQPHNYYYISLFNDGVGYSHKIELNKNNYKWQTKVLNKSTVAEEWGEEEKVITYIPIKDCKKFYFNISDDAKIK